MKGVIFIFLLACRNGVVEKEQVDENQNLDQDEDGFPKSDDCDDANSTINPFAEEICDGVDNDCDGQVDEGVLQTLYVDADEDGYGDPDSPVEACEISEGLSLVGNDCNDQDELSYPGSAERCDGVDNDCDEEIDEDLQEIWFADKDGDGYGDADDFVEICDPPDGYVSVALDCDDLNGDINLDAIEICDGVDNDCDGLIDDADGDVDYSTATDYYLDADGDGHGADLLESGACTPPENGVALGDDCDDEDGAVYPGAIEFCDLIDNDCDGLIDLEDTDVEGSLTWYFDSDRDGFGTSNDTLESCEQPPGYELLDGDCDDDDASINPEARETCDERDENCDGQVDEGALGSENVCPGQSCYAILLDGSDDGDGLYWLDPDGDGLAPIQGWCDMTTDGGGWTRLFGSLYPTFWQTLDWESHGSSDYDSFSILGRRIHFADSNGTYRFRLQLGSSGNWDTTTPDHQTIWEQSHDPFSSSSSGSDYLLISGTEVSTCGGFNGLHNQHYSDGGLYAVATEQDSGDISNCWWLQVVPLQQYGSSTIYGGYIDGYGGSGGIHSWQQLWVR